MNFFERRKKQRPPGPEISPELTRLQENRDPRLEEVLHDKAGLYEEYANLIQDNLPSQEAYREDLLSRIKRFESDTELIKQLREYLKPYESLAMEERPWHVQRMIQALGQQNTTD